MTTRWEVSGAPNTRFSGFEHVSETGSTNKDLLDAGRAGEPEGRVLITDHQTTGRGRQGRAWVEQPGTSLLMSVLLRPDPSWAPLLPLAFGVAVVAAVESLVPDDAGMSVGLKWPNDVLVQASTGERKLAGILAEAITVDGALVVVVGCGMNLRPSSGIPAEVSAKAIALSALADGEVDRFELARAVLTDLEAILVQLEGENRARVLDTYRSRCVSIGRELRLETPSGEVVGRAVSVGDDGALHLETSTGIVALTAGEAHHL